MPLTRQVCPSNLQQGLILRVSGVTVTGKGMVFLYDCDYHDTFSTVVCYCLSRHSPQNVLIGIRYWRRAVNEGHRAIESCVECECYES
jgi:hypothetical protein